MGKLEIYRLGTELKPSEVVRSYRYVSAWFRIVQSMGISDSVIEGFAKALIHFLEWARPHAPSGKSWKSHETNSDSVRFAEYQLQLDMAVREITSQKDRIRRKNVNKAALKGSIPLQNEVLSWRIGQNNIFRRRSPTVLFVQSFEAEKFKRCSREWGTGWRAVV